MPNPKFLPQLHAAQEEQETRGHHSHQCPELRRTLPSYSIPVGARAGLPWHPALQGGEASGGGEAPGGGQGSSCLAMRWGKISVPW